MTRAKVEQKLFEMAGPKLAIVGIRPSATILPVPELDYPIAQALSEVGIQAASFPDVSDSDLTQIPTALLPKFFDVLEVVILEFVLSRWDQADQTAGSENQQNLGKLYSAIESTVDRKRKFLSVRYPSTIEAPAEEPSGSGRVSFGLNYLS